MASVTGLLLGVLTDPWKLFLTCLILSLTYLPLHVFHRLVLHPLASYPGPPLWAITKLVPAYYILQGRLPFTILALHNKYGPVVRTGPNELSYIDESAWSAIYGLQADKMQLQKSLPFTTRHPNGSYSILTTPDDADHARMRRNLSAAFSDVALRRQEAYMTPYFDLLMQRLRERCDDGRAALNMCSWFDFTTFDLIGDLTFGESFHCLEEGKYHGWIEAVFSTLKHLTIHRSLAQYWPLDKIALWFEPKHVQSRNPAHMRYVKQRVDERLDEKAPRESDFMSSIQKRLATPDGMPTGEIQSTAVTLVVAGSETTSTLLSGALYLLLSNRDKLAILVDEIRTAFARESDITMISVNTLKYELAVLNEALRMFPPIPNAHTRETSTSTKASVADSATEGAGRMICDRYVPPGVTVGVPHWAAYYSARNFRNPRTFAPERWLGEDNQYANDRRGVLQPFSHGPRGCLGRNLAYAEMRVILARLLWNFDLELSWESEGWLESLPVFILWKKRPLMVRLKPVRRT